MRLKEAKGRKRDSLIHLEFRVKDERRGRTIVEEKASLRGCTIHLRVHYFMRDALDL
jgi:hypothetical protein